MGYRNRKRLRIATTTANDQSRITDKAQELITEFGLDADQITGTGKGGRVITRDVKNFLATSDVPEPTQEPTPPVTGEEE